MNESHKHKVDPKKPDSKKNTRRIIRFYAFLGVGEGKLGLEEEQEKLVGSQ